MNKKRLLCSISFHCFEHVFTGFLGTVLGTVLVPNGSVLEVPNEPNSQFDRYIFESINICKINIYTNYPCFNC